MHRHKSQEPRTSPGLRGLEHKIETIKPLYLPDAGDDELLTNCMKAGE